MSNNQNNNDIYNDPQCDSRYDLKMDSSGPYIGVVTRHLDQQCMGRIQIWIQELSGGLPPDNETTWIKADYASPFFGSTVLDPRNVDAASTTQSYGMWFVPPDLGIQVLVMFVNNDPHRCYWFACVPAALSNHMVPGIAGRKACNPDAATNDPVTEYDKVAAAAAGITGAKAIADPKITPTHVIQQRILQNQGLDKDIARGIGISTARRETPSTVFGISTPGRVTKRLVEDPTQSAIGYQMVTGRYGGHQFIMDDGNALGDSQLVKLRSAQGGTIMINDTIGSIYVINQSGSAWVELSANGRIDIYGNDSFSVHSEKDINFTADNDINIFASNNLNIVANQINTDAATQLHHSSKNFYTRSPDVITESDSLTFIAQKGAGSPLASDQASQYGSGLVIVADNGDLQFAKFEDGKPKIGEGNIKIQSFTGTASVQSVMGTELQSLTNVTLHSEGKLELFAKGGIFEDPTALPQGLGSVFALVSVLELEMGSIAKALQLIASYLAGSFILIQNVAAYVGDETAATAAGNLSAQPTTTISPIAAAIVTVMRAYGFGCNWHAGITAKIKKLQDPIVRTSAVVPITKLNTNNSTNQIERTHVPIMPQREPWAGHEIQMSDSTIDISTGLNTGDAMFTTGKGVAFPEETTKISQGGT